MTMKRHGFVNWIKHILSTIDTSHREQAAGLTEFEARELENIFVLLLMGSFTGIPAPPSFIAAELLPHLQHEIKVLKFRAENASDSLAEMAGLLGID
ncbi:MAG: hypothetical protein KAU17_14515 [Spirochaetales bacterium]|nr:hypothetical protein [Spirochaetales bacterium]